MIDYAIQPNSDMIKFYNWLKVKGIEFYWIDHHITAIENIGSDTLPGYVFDGSSACANTWGFVSELQENIFDHCPKIINLINDIDIWNKNSKYSWDDEILPIVYYLNSLGSDLNDNKNKLVLILKDFFNSDASLVNPIKAGHYILDFVKSQERRNIKKIYEREWNGYKCLILNTTVSGSEQFEEHPEYQNADLLITWSYDGKCYYYGLYTTKSNIDVGEICQTFFNGGGHKGCGGGQLKKFLFS